MNLLTRFFAPASTRKTRGKLAIIARCRDEPFLEEFVEHYLFEGADRIFLLEDNLDMALPTTLIRNPRVELLKATRWAAGGHQTDDVAALYLRIRSDCEWVAFVDCDEFITTRRNPRRTLLEELRTTFSRADCVLVPWVMMASGGREQDPHSLLEEIDHRWDHDRRHPNDRDWRKGRCRYDEIEVKSVFRAAAVSAITDVHIPTLAVPSKARVVDSVNNEPSALRHYYRNLRNADIVSALLICQHYRIPSRSSAERKVHTSTRLTAGGGYADVDAIMSTDYAEVEDHALRNKTRMRRADRAASEILNAH